MKHLKLAKYLTILAAALVLVSPLMIKSNVSATTLTQSGAVGVQVYYLEQLRVLVLQS